MTLQNQTLKKVLKINIIDTFYNLNTIEQNFF